MGAYRLCVACGHMIVLLELCDDQFYDLTSKVHLTSIILRMLNTRKGEMESWQELLDLLEEVKIWGRTVLEEVLARVGTKLVLHRLPKPQVSSEETPKGLEVYDLDTF